MKFLKRFTSVLSLVVFLLLWSVAFAEIDWFSIDVKDTINLWEAVDFTVSAIEDWEIFKEFSWYVVFDIIDKNGNALDSDLYTISSYWYYNFLETDQWTKTFSKWLEIRKAGDYTIRVNWIDGWDWSTTIRVVWESGSQDTEIINITYPIDGSTETKGYVTVLWSCEKLKNSPVIIYLNDRVVWSWQTDAKWNFSVLVPDLLSWGNEIQAKIVDISNVVLGESPVISVKYQQLEDGTYKWMEILPSNEVKQWDKVTFNVRTDDWVNSVQLIFSNWSKYSMDRIWQWLFSKEIEATFTGTIDISVSLMVNTDEKIYEKAETLLVKEYIWVSNIKFIATGVDWSQVIVSWETIGDIPRYQINYWTWKEDLSKSTTVSSSSVLIENLDKDVTYFFQIIPQDLDAHTSWDPSDIVEYRPSALSCVVKWIKVVTEKIWDNYYLVRDPVENAISYEVYRSDWADMTDARLVWNLTGTRFQYLYNPDATKDEYAFYQVQAICPDWKNVVVDKAQKVKVWPVENMLLIIIISIFVYSLYRLNRISDDNY